MLRHLVTVMRIRPAETAYVVRMKTSDTIFDRP